MDPARSRGRDGPSEVAVWDIRVSPDAGVSPCETGRQYRARVREHVGSVGGTSEDSEDETVGGGVGDQRERPAAGRCGATGATAAWTKQVLVQTCDRLPVQPGAAQGFGSQGSHQERTRINL